MFGTEKWFYENQTCTQLHLTLALILGLYPFVGPAYQGKDIMFRFIIEY
jgi:hypothetical protein